MVQQHHRAPPLRNDQQAGQQGAAQALPAVDGSHSHLQDLRHTKAARVWSTACGTVQKTLRALSS